MTDLIVDANSMYASAWYAAHEDPFGTLVGSLNVAFMLVNPVRVGEHIDRTLFCWDAAQKSDKQRKERPPEYEDTKSQVKSCLETILGATNARIGGYEADDLLATAAEHTTADHVIVASSDKDLHQLNSPRISIFDIRNKGMVSKREICAQWHVKRPSHVAIALAISGDAVDKISGIKGWGPKKVEKLFEAVTEDMEFFQVIETIVQQIPESKLPEFYQSLELTFLNRNIPGMPSPSPLNLLEPSELKGLGLQEVHDHYQMVFRKYLD